MADYRKDLDQETLELIQCHIDNEYGGENIFTILGVKIYYDHVYLVYGVDDKKVQNSYMFHVIKYPVMHISEQPTFGCWSTINGKLEYNGK